MGNTSCCGPQLTPAQREDKQVSEQIDRLLQQDKALLGKEVKLLLLGTGDSGKSTFAKQMKIIHLHGFSNEERQGLKKIMHINVIMYMKTLLQQAAIFGYSLKEENKEHEQVVLGIDNSQLKVNTVDLTPKLAQSLIGLWADPAIKEQTMSRYREFQLHESAPYFFDRLEKISAPDYVPSDSDLLRVRTKTTGIVEIEFEILELKFKMVDVGGQRNERKKWIHCFDCVTAIIFVVALSEYDLFLEENPSQNRMLESIKLFDDIVNNAWFSKTAVILLLNKRDLFEEKIQNVDLSTCFPEYKGGKDFQAGCEFVENKFLSKNRGTKDRKMFTHVTCATDTENIRVVFTAVKQIILDELLSVLW